MSIALDLTVDVQVTMDYVATAIMNFAQLSISVNYTHIARFKLGLMALHWGLPHDAIFDQNVFFAKMTSFSKLLFKVSDFVVSLKYSSSL